MSTPAVLDVTAATFQREVVERSRDVPVLIDFWATWCGPCKTLGPLLEKLALELAGRFVLAKVDVDANPELAEAFRIQSIPSVILVKDGRPVDGFMGALPEAQLRTFLEPHLGAAQVTALERAQELEQAGELEEAIGLLREHLRGAEDPPARTGLARLLLAAGRAPDARKVFEKLPEAERETDAARAVAAQLALLESAGDLDELSRAVSEAPGDVAARVAYGKALLAAGRHEDGFEELMAAVMLDPDQPDDAARRALVEGFAMLGPTHPSTLEYQQRLSVLLCS